MSKERNETLSHSQGGKEKKEKMVATKQVIQSGKGVSRRLMSISIVGVSYGLRAHKDEQEERSSYTSSTQNG